MGECKMQLNQFRDAVQYFTVVVAGRPKNAAGWEALIRCLYKAPYLDEALQQVQAAIIATSQKPIFFYYKAAILFAMGKSKEALIQLEDAMVKSPKLLKKFVELNPAVLQNQSVVDIVARFKRNKSI